jgi:hypothetical protein
VVCGGFMRPVGLWGFNTRMAMTFAAYVVWVVWGGGGLGPGGVRVEGEIKLPYISEENQDEDPELLVTTSSEGKDAQAARAVVLGYGKKVGEQGGWERRWQGKESAHS